MKKILLSALFLFAINILASAQEYITLTVKVEGVNYKEGTLKLAIFNNEKDFLNNSIHEFKIDLTKDKNHVFEVPGLKVGEYAFSVIHDKNNNGDLDMGMMGPTEAYGFSNNARGMFGPAEYKDAVMQIEKDKTVTINIK